MTSARVAIVDSVPLYRLGLATACADADFETSEFASLDAVPAEVSFTAAVAVLRDRASWAMLRQRARSLAPVMIAVVPEVDAKTVELALAAGAATAVAEDATPEEIVPTIQAALEGKTLLPTAVAQGVLFSSRDLDPQEVAWLRLAADGQTIRQIAAKAGFEERQMRRRLKRAYSKLGARTMRQALLRADKEGLLD